MAAKKLTDVFGKYDGILATFRVLSLVGLYSYRKRDIFAVGALDGQEKDFIETIIILISYTKQICKYECKYRNFSNFLHYATSLDI